MELFEENFYKEINSSGKIETSQKENEKKTEARLIEFPNASKVFSECLCSAFAKFK